jgi:hypothetical protein
MEEKRERQETAVRAEYGSSTPRSRGISGEGTPEERLHKRAFRRD